MVLKKKKILSLVGARPQFIKEAVVNEAMAERRCVIGTYEAGSSATIIEHGINGFLYHAGNITELQNLLRSCNRETIQACGNRTHETFDYCWSPSHAAERLLEFIDDVKQS